MCDMDHYQNIGGIYCRIFSFIQFTKNILPEKQTIKIIAYPSLANYLQYYFYPYFNLTDKIEKADYLVYYFPIDYNYQNNFLYSKGQNNQEKVIGEYFLVGERGAQELILKKIKE